MQQIKNSVKVGEGGGASSLKYNSAPKMELGNSAQGLEGKVSLSIEELGMAISELNYILSETPYRLALIRASTITEDNSNLYQVAELRTQPDEIFLKIVWMSPRPFEWGIAVYKRFG